MMASQGYLAHMACDEQANLFHGEGLNLRDVVTFQGQSVAELRQAFADSVEDYLSCCAERGAAPEQPFSGRFTVQLSPEQQRKIVLAAEKAGKDVAQWVAEALEQAVGRSVRDEVRAEPGPGADAVARAAHAWPFGG